MNTYTWDARNHLTAISGAATASFTYDAFGRRASKTIAGISTQFLYDILNSVQEIQAGAPSANLLAGLNIDEYLTRTDSSNNVSTLLTDAIGSTIGLVGSGQSIATSYTYDPFGATTVAGAANGNSYQFTGRENDGTGLYSYRARYYSAAFQRFVSQDPIGFGGGDVNLYAYAGQDPTNLFDPLGLWQYWGNWGGPEWTGGSTKQYEDMTADEVGQLQPPIDSQDRCYQTHDICYSSCRVQSRGGKCGSSQDGRECADTCNAGLISCLSQIPFSVQSLDSSLHAAAAEEVFIFLDPTPGFPSK